MIRHAWIAMDSRKAGNFGLVVLLAGLAAIGPFSIDTYLPSFPSIGAAFTASPLQVQQTLSAYMAAFAIMMLFHGTLSDSFGRKAAILVSLGIYCLASIGCAVAGSLPMLIFFRVIQGLSAGGGLVIGRAIIRDRFEGAAAQKLLSQVTVAFSVAPAIAPIIGGWLHSAFGWRSVFAFMILLGLLMFAICFPLLPETLPVASRQQFRMPVLVRNYLQTIRNGRFLALSFTSAFTFSGLFLYLAASPAYVIHVLGLANQGFALLFAPTVFGLAFGAWLASRLSGRISAPGMISYGYLVMGLAAFINLAYNFFFPARIPWAVLPIMLYAVGMSLVMPNLTVLVLDIFPETRGLAASLQAFIQTLWASFISGLIVPLIFNSARALAVAMVLSLSGGQIAWHISRILDNRSKRQGKAEI